MVQIIMKMSSGYTMFILVKIIQMKSTTFGFIMHMLMHNGLIVRMIQFGMKAMLTLVSIPIVVVMLMFM